MMRRKAVATYGAVQLCLFHKGGEENMKPYKFMMFNRNPATGGAMKQMGQAQWVAKSASLAMRGAAVLRVWMELKKMQPRIDKLIDETGAGGVLLMASFSESDLPNDLGMKHVSYSNVQILAVGDNADDAMKNFYSQDRLISRRRIPKGAHQRRMHIWLTRSG
jgi:hypothetical protein